MVPRRAKAGKERQKSPLDAPAWVWHREIMVIEIESQFSLIRAASKPAAGQKQLPIRPHAPGAGSTRAENSAIFGSVVWSNSNNTTPA